jgi:hypothetical protein
MASGRRVASESPLVDFREWKAIARERIDLRDGGPVARRVHLRPARTGRVPDGARRCGPPRALRGRFASAVPVLRCGRATPRLVRRSSPVPGVPAPPGEGRWFGVNARCPVTAMAVAVAAKG